MFTTRRYIIQSNPMTVEVGIHADIIFFEKLWDESKATVKYCSAIRVAKIMKKVSTKERRDGLTLFASNSVSEILHGALTDFLQVSETISIPHAAAMGQSSTNNDHVHDHKKLVTG